MQRCHISQTFLSLTCIDR